MKRSVLRWITVALVFAMLLPVGGLAASELLNVAAKNAGDASAKAASLATAPLVYLNEIMPRPEPGQHQWVELSRPGTRYFQYLPLVVKGVGSLAYSPAQPVSGQSNMQADPDISGWQLTSKTGQSYIIPDALPPVPQGAFVLIYFDGAGSAMDDYDFADQVAVLHTPPGLVDTFDPTCRSGGALCWRDAQRPDNPRLRRLRRAARVTRPAMRSRPGYGTLPPGLTLYIGSGAVVEGEAPATDRAIGLYPGHTNLSSEDWAIYTVADLTPGELIRYRVPPGARITMVP